MTDKKYREIPADFPSGNASEKIVKGCVVVEGGAFRGVYSQGVMDALMENDINMECTIGVSAGAMGGMCYVAGDIGRAIRVNVGFRKDPRYVGFLPLFTDAGVIGFDFVFNETPKTLNFNYDRFFSPERRFACVVTNCLTGEAEVKERGKVPNIFQAIRASASMPYFSKPVILEGVPYLDGGCARNSPWKWAKDEGYEKVLLIRNRPVGYRREDKPDVKAKFYSKDFPELAKVLAEDGKHYYQECIEGEEAHKRGDVFMLCPGTTETVGRLEKSLERLSLFYWLGYYETLAKMPQIKQYLLLD